VPRTVFLKHDVKQRKKKSKLLNDISNLSWNSAYELKDGASFDTSGILAIIAMTAALVNLLIASAS